MTDTATNTNTSPRNDLARRPAGEVSRRTTGGGLAKPAAVYDSVTEGLTGWQFLRTWRWIGFMAAAVIFALLCAGLASWQYDRGRGASADNLLYSDNFAAATVPLTTALPTRASFDPDQVWRSVSMRGTWDASHQYYLRNSIRSGVTGFEVVTPLRLTTGGTFLVDRGWVAASSTDMTVPAHRPAPPTGTTDVVARLQGSQPSKGTGGVVNDQIESVDLTEIAPTVGGTPYTQAWGVIVSPTSTTQSLARVQATPPAEGVGYHYSYMIQWILFALIGFFLLWRGAVTEYRRLNVDDPDEQLREAARLRRRSRKAFTDEETEDETLDGFVPISRWTGRSGLPTAVAATPVADRPALRGTPIPFDAATETDTHDRARDELATPDTHDAPSQAGDVLVLDPEPIRVRPTTIPPSTRPAKTQPTGAQPTERQPTEPQPRKPSNGST